MTALEHPGISNMQLFVLGLKLTFAVTYPMA